MKSLLSVIVQTSPNRETHLKYCLEQLKKQTFKDFELLVVDDGSSGGEEIVAASGIDLIRYVWRQNDCCLSRSRNIGYKMSQTPYLVYIDSDILLQPRALEHYFNYLCKRKNTLVCGYFGNDRLKRAPSIWFPMVEVNWYDRRFYFNHKNALVIEQELLKKPHLYAFGGNFAIDKVFYEVVNGFDENFVGWGCEDIDFANRVLLSNGSIHFLLDVWAEHQCHESKEVFHQISAKPEVVKVKEDKIANLVSSTLKNRVVLAKERETLTQAIFEHYFPSNQAYDETTQFQMLKAIVK